MSLPGGEGDSREGCVGGGWGQGCGVGGRRSEGLCMGSEQHRVRGAVQRYCALLGRAVRGRRVSCEGHPHTVVCVRGAAEREEWGCPMMKGFYEGGYMGDGEGRGV